MSEIIEIVNFESTYKEAFRDYNVAWIKAYFKMEDKDVEVLNNPEKYILDKGGFILVALCNKKVAGVCALIKATEEKYDFELSKMAVASEFRGKGIGKKLAEAIIDKARSEQAKIIFLDSNTCLKEAINLYKKLGFKEVKEQNYSYERTNIKMELEVV